MYVYKYTYIFLYAFIIFVCIYSLTFLFLRHCFPMEPWLSWNKLCRPAWPQIHCDLPASAASVLWLNVCTIMCGISMCLFNSNIIFWIDFHFNNCYILRRLFISLFFLIGLIFSIFNFPSHVIFSSLLTLLMLD